MIVPPWLFFVMHMVQGYSLSNAWGRWYGPAARYPAYLWHICVATSEHFTLGVPAFDHLAFKYNFFQLAGYEFLFFLYLAYCNPGADDLAANKRRLLGWAILTPIMTVVLVKLGFGPPDPLTPNHLLELMATERYNAGHFFGHFFFTMCFAFVASYAQFDRNPRMGFGFEFIKRQLVRFWAPIRERPVIAKFGWCVLVGALAVTISNWDSVNIIRAGDAPFFPPMCMARVVAKDECTFLGITIPCYKTFSSDAIEYFGFGMEMSHLWTFFSTFIIGAFYLWSTPCQKFSYAAVRGYSLTITCALYAMLTSSFALIRMFWGVSKPLLLAAALHNLFEWAIVIHVWDFSIERGSTLDQEKFRRFSWSERGSTPHQELFRRFSWATLFICSIIAVCMCIPNLFLALALEQLFGIMLDFALPMMFLAQAARGGRYREIFWRPAAAHTIHILATILPLVFSIFLSGHVSWFVNFYLEIAINLSVPISHFLYCSWAHWLAEEDKLRAERRAGEAPDLASSSAPPNHQPPREVIPESGLLEQQYRIQNVPRFLIGGLVLGVVVLGVAPQIFLDECDGSGCTAQSYVAKTNTLQAHDIKAHEFPMSRGLVRQMRKSYPGLEDITVGHARGEVAGTGFFIVEKWEAIEDINEDLFDSLANATNQKGWSRTSYAPTTVSTFTCPEKRIGHLSHNITSHSCKSVWKVLESRDLCAWVPGCKLMEDTENESRSKLYLTDGHILDAAVKRNKKDWEIEVSILSQSRLNGFFGEISLERIGRSACTVNYHYRRSLRYGSKGSSENTFLQKFIPEIEDRLEK